VLAGGQIIGLLPPVCLRASAPKHGAL